MKTFISSTIAIALLTIAGTGAADTPKLRLGDPAPELSVAKWFKGAPVAKLEDGNIYVVEFWATWCGPCRVTIPHLTEIARKFEGKAHVIGVSIWENEKEDEARFKKIDEFVTKMGEKMDYHVAADTADGVMAKKWMAAAGERGIPSAFIVGKDGKVAWIGHPSGGLETTLAKVIDGTYDVQAAAEKREKDQVAAEREQELFKPISALRREGKNQEALEALDKVLADHPEFKNRYAQFRYTLLLDCDEPAAYRFAKELADGQYKDNANMLAALSRAIADRNTKLKNPDYDTALSLAKQACAISKNKNPDHLAAVAEVQYRTHQYGKAIETIQQAIALIAEKKDAPEGAAKTYQARLERFQKMKEKREGAASEQKKTADEEKK